MDQIKIKTSYKKVLSDLGTPVGLYLKVRERYAEALLLESSDYSSKENSLSFICFDPIQSIQLSSQHLEVKNHRTEEVEKIEVNHLVHDIENILDKVNIQIEEEVNSFVGFFGYSSFNSVQFFDTIRFDIQKPGSNIPLMRYAFYRYIYVFDHFSEDLYLIDNTPKGEDSNLDLLENLFKRQDTLTFNFKIKGGEASNMEDEDFKSIVTQCKAYCHRGDVFQIVPSRQFNQGFLGDEFNVYRALRSINPSPYLFYFDYGSFKIFGSSPEAQLIVDEGMAEIHPIAGTFKRTGNDAEDRISAEALKNDPKESAEHIMLVDLARNDLSKNAEEVTVEKFKEIQFFSHVIHLTSIVKGKLKKGVSGLQIFADTFPAGTLSGAPKYRAMELIDQHEPTQRSFYGGGIGLLKLNGDINHAIIIRSFLSQGGKLHYQAGAGIVIDSDEENELQEVNNKLAALKNALIKAESI